MVAHELGHPARYQRAYPCMRPYRRRLAQAHLAIPAVSRERFRQNPLGVVPRAGEERHHRHLIRLELVQHGLESGLALMKRYRDFVEDAALPQRLRHPPNQRVGLRVAAGAMGGQNQRPAHRLTWSWTNSNVGCSRPVSAVRASGQPTIRW